MKKIWSKFKGLDFNIKAMLLSIPFSIALLLYLVSIGAADLIFSTWYINLISVPALFANQLATAAYVGRGMDLIRITARKPKPNRFEIIGTALGFAMGIATGIALCVLQVIPIPLLGTLGIFAYFLSTFRQINIFVILGNLLGRNADKNSRPLSEKITVGLGAFFGALLGVVLVATCTAAMMSVVGLTLFFSGGAAVPAWIGGIIFVLTTSSTIAAFSDYAVRAANFVRSFFTKDHAIKQRVNNSKFEYGGTLTGVAIGITVSLIVVTALAICNPAVMAGVVGAVLGTLIVAVGTSVFAGTAARIGRIIDNLKRKKPKPTAADDGHNDFVVKPVTKLIENKCSPTQSRKKVDLSDCKHDSRLFKRHIAAPRNQAAIEATPYHSARSSRSGG